MMKMILLKKGSVIRLFAPSWLFVCVSLAVGSMIVGEGCAPANYVQTTHSLAYPGEASWGRADSLEIRVLDSCLQLPRQRARVWFRVGGEFACAPGFLSKISVVQVSERLVRDTAGGAPKVSGEIILDPSISQVYSKKPCPKRFSVEGEMRIGTFSFFVNRYVVRVGGISKEFVVYQDK